MTAKQLANIALRLLGALWTLSAIISLPNLLQLSSAADIQTRKLMLGSGVGELVWLIAGVALFLKSEKLAAFFFPGAELLSISASAQDLQQVGFSLLSVYFGISAAGRVAGLIYLAIRSEPFEESRLSYLWRLNPERLVSAGFELLICVALFFGSRALSHLWWRLRGDGRAANLPSE